MRSTGLLSSRSKKMRVLIDSEGRRVVALVYEEAFSRNLYGNLISAIKITNTLPLDEDHSYYATFPDFKTRMGDFGKRLLQLTQNLAQTEDPKRSSLFDVDDEVDEIADQFSGIVEVANVFLASTTVSKGGKSNEYNMFYGQNIQRPQLKFEDPVDNSNYPFLPKISDKPNAMTPLDPIFDKARPEISPFGKIVRTKEQEKIVFPHPYEYEINHFQYMPKQTAACKEMLYKGLDETPYTWIDRPEQLTLLCDKLNQVEEFAVDLEAHSYRSFQGFVCLMQISTRTEDFIIDTLVLRASLRILNVPFTNPKIVKVLHGSESDIKWLQRDFGIYVVNMFDTGQASRLLEYPSASLAFLLRFYCSVDANKKFQLADWRIRAVPEEMIKYAREDTHYLLYIYDRLRNELISKGKSTNNYLLEVLRRSKELCLLKYEKEIIDDAAHLDFCKKMNLAYAPVQMRLFKILFYWREKVARDEDESVRYVLPNAMILLIVEKQPSTVTDLLGCCSPVPPYLKVHAHELLLEFTKAKASDSDMSKIMPAGINRFLPSPVLSTHDLYKTAGWLDSSNSEPIPMNTLISPMPRRTATVAPVNQNNHSNASFPQTLIFDSSDESCDDVESQKHKKIASMVKSSFELSSSTAPTYKPISELKAVTQQTNQPMLDFDALGDDDDEDDDDNKSAKSNDMDESDFIDTQLSDSGEEDIPKSMEEIYQLSNLNRRRNKEKKKLKETAPFSQATQFNEQTKQKKGDLDADPITFMKGIGWIPDGGSYSSNSIEINESEKD
eukprot:gene3459-3934_t